MESNMYTILLTLTVGATLASDRETPRKPHPLFPSLVELTDEEEEKLDQIIDRFIEYDTGKLKGAEGKKALAEFQKLGPDAIPALIRGLNKAAKIEHSCPAVTIAKKLSRMFSSSKDTELLEFARENMGAGITRSRHMGVIKDLRVQCMLRKRAVAQSGQAILRSSEGLRGDSTSPRGSGQKPLRTLSISELVEAAGKERGSKLKMVLTELGNRRGDAVIGALGSAAATYDGDVQKQARELLDRQLSSLKTDPLKEKLKDDRAEVRAAAARIVGNKGLHLESELIELLTDEDAGVRSAGHQSLVKLSKGTDFGPKAGASEAERKQSAKEWRTWLERQHDR
jgi:hypothetical protein